MKLLILNGIVCDPSNKFEKKADILIENGKIVNISIKSKKRKLNAKIIDAKGKYVVPGLIDMHTHLREPGREDEETIKTGTRAAAMGGFTTVCSMPNTQPVIDSVSGVKFILTTAKNEGIVNVFPIGAITKGSNGLELAEIGKMKGAGIIAISDDGKSVMNAIIMRRALEYSKMFGLPVISHCEDMNLSANGEINEGYISTVLGLKGIPRQAEEIMVARDIALTELTDGKLHIAHMSTARSVELVRNAKKRGIKVTAETAPHYFSLTDEEIKNTDYNTNTKMNPPLRTIDDINAICKGLSDGTIDCIASDHAPHLIEEKEQEFRVAPFGIIGLETMLPLIITKLVNEKVISFREVIAKLTCNPAKILGLRKGTLSVGSDADVTIIDSKQTKTIEKFESKCKNSPFIGKELTGFATTTIVSGKVVMDGGKIVSD
ncbi:MAG: dihydroorotase [Elusimicrobia bacterium RIFOXYC2_FULL_34_12]|nr:MAG: dihydroorotase [Elusimicrobia bacterium RIFOXYC2_FULL_34_12]HAM38723.1 dihydroorotase [Elusimicrobiota bacterium]